MIKTRLVQVDIDNDPFLAVLKDKVKVTNRVEIDQCHYLH